MSEARRVLAGGGRLVIIARPGGLAQADEVARGLGFVQLASGVRRAGRRRVEVLSARVPRS